VLAAREELDAPAAGGARPTAGEEPDTLTTGGGRRATGGARLAAANLGH
jgi:hypothetical protein